MVTMPESERIINSLDTNALLEIDGVLDVVDPVELNALIIVMSNGKRYKMLVEEYDEQSFFVMRNSQFLMLNAQFSIIDILLPPKPYPHILHLTSPTPYHLTPTNCKLFCVFRLNKIVFYVTLYI